MTTLTWVARLRQLLSIRAVTPPAGNKQPAKIIPLFPPKTRRQARLIRLY